MSLKYGVKGENWKWSQDDAPPPRYSEIDETTPLVLKKSNKENVKQVFGLRRSSLLLILYLLFYLVYLITGGLVFTVLEAPEEEEVKKSIIDAKKAFLASNPSVKDESLEDLISKILSASNKGISVERDDPGESNWSFGQSLFFSVTVVTTIGYGHVTPLSKAGKCFCIIYAILGIPLTLMLLTALVERLMIPSSHLLNYLSTKLKKFCGSFEIRLLHLLIIAVILLTFFLFIPAAVFDYLETDWDYMDSVYYCFISLTTIGLGDYIPGDAPNQPFRPLYKVLTTCYLLAGLTFLVFTLSVFYDIPQLNFGIFFLRESDEAADDDDDDYDEEKIEPKRIHLPQYEKINFTLKQEKKEKHHPVT